ncbi:CPLN1 protein, partial [Rhinoptilus africanus]|nr:CPLN1 protein [Rhinoptilus africanus]
MLPHRSTSRGRMRNAANSPVNSRYSAEHRGGRTSRQKPTHVATAVQTEGVDQEADRDVVSPWTVPDEIQRILQDTHDSLFQASAPHPVSFSPLGTINTDGVSDSTGSVLSKLDWGAIEAMVADVEDV